MRKSVIALLIVLSVPVLSAATRRRASVNDYCRPVVSPATITMPAEGGHASLQVTMYGRGGSGSCLFTPLSTADWIAATAAGSAQLSLEIDVPPNTSGTTRTGIVHVRSAVVAVTQPSADLNLLTNGTFTTSLAGWSDTYSTGAGKAAWAADVPGDILILPVPIGVAAITSTQRGAGYQLNQCVNVTSGTTYDLGTSVFIPVGQAAGSVVFGFATYDQPGCPSTSSATGLRTLNTATPTGSWFPMTTSISVDQRTSSLLVIIAAGQSQAPPFTAYFDNVYVKARK